MAEPRLTFVSVGYEAEYPFLELQARSMAVHLAPQQVHEVLLIDNSAKPMPADVRERLIGEYGPLASRVTVLRPEDIVKTSGGVGWSTQQVLKLAIAARVASDAYVVLDAKNHFIAPLGSDFFRAADGRLRVPAYSFETHPLRKNLEHVLGYLGIDPAPHVRRFPATVTPFVLSTELVRELIAGIEQRSGRPFAREFLKSDLTEFFLYSGWILASGRKLEDVYDLDIPQSPAVWPKAADAAGVRAAIATAEERRAPFFAVHRRALANLTADGGEVLAGFWAERGLFPTTEAARRFIADFRLAHEAEAKAQARRDLPRKLLAAPRKVRRKLLEKLGSARG